jgi:hypothetical protein
MSSKQVGGNHYARHAIQPWHIIEEYDLDYWLGNVIKYVLRHREKGGIEDLRKAQHYLEHSIDRMEREEVQVCETPEEELPALIRRQAE